MLHGRIDIIGREPLRADVMSRERPTIRLALTGVPFFRHALLAAENIGISA